MVIVHNADHHKYIDQQRQVETIRYINGVKKIFEGQAIYLPCRVYEGENIFGDIFNFIANNKDTISNVATAAFSVADSVGKICNTTLDIIKTSKKLKIKQPITDDVVNIVLNASEVKGSGFFYV